MKGDEGIRSATPNLLSPVPIPTLAFLRLRRRIARQQPLSRLVLVLVLVRQRGYFTDAASDPPGDSAALSCSRHARRDAMIAFTAERATFHHANGRGSASMLSARA